MEIVLLSPGLFKDKSPEKIAFETYQKRLSSKITLIEMPHVKNLDVKMITSIQDKKTSHGYITGLDEKGEALTSFAFAKMIEEIKNRSFKNLMFVIGPADGLGTNLTSQCTKLLSFGRMTWPHMMMRVLLAEQLYRAQQITNQHPYHRIGIREEGPSHQES